MGNVGPETQGSSLALPYYHRAVRYLCILGMVAWLSDDQRQEETKQGSKISLLRDNRSYAHYSHQCCGSTYLPKIPKLEFPTQTRGPKQKRK